MSKEREIKKAGTDIHATDELNPHSTALPTDNQNNSKQNKKLCKALKVILLNDDTKFMSDFDPEQSNREKRKLTRKFTSDGKKHFSAHDENSISVGSDKDVCDCLNDGCSGCHFPCPKCKSSKCGLDCRVNRKWVYEEVENEGGSRVNKIPKIT